MFCIISVSAASAFLSNTAAYAFRFRAPLIQIHRSNNNINNKSRFYSSIASSITHTTSMRQHEKKESFRHFPHTRFMPMTTLRNSAASTSATEKDYKQPPNTEEISLEKTQEAALANNTEMWEKFEFSDSPKHDTRFAGDLTHNIQHTSDKSFENIMESEAKKDTQMKDALKGQNKALLQLDPEVVQKATDVLKEYITPERFERLNTTLSQRTGNCRLLFENPANPSNVWACMR